MKQDAILFIDIDDGPSIRYQYRDPHFAAARALGLTCLTAGVSGRDHLQRLEYQGGEYFLLADLSEAAIVNLVGSLGDRYTVRAIFCYAGHASARGDVGCIVARASQTLGLVYSNPDAIAACNNKFLMRQVLQNKQLRSVPFALCNNEQMLAAGAARVGYPLIAKPAFGGASAFIKKCADWAELRAHYQQYLAQHDTSGCADFYGYAHMLHDEEGAALEYIPGRSILLEGYIEGVEGTVECVIVGDRVHPVLINEKLLLTARSGTILENLLITPPTSFSEQQCAHIRQYAKDCLQAIGMTNAIVHLEFRLTEAGPVVIEINSRLGGLYVNAALRDLAGVDPYQLYVSLLLGDSRVAEGLQARAQRAADSTQHYAMLALYPEHSGYFRGVQGEDYLKGNESIVEYAQQAPGSYLDAEVEEHYLLKCWAHVEDAAAASVLHDALVRQVRPVIEQSVGRIA
ncbi:ATP-grasp domain-containing protein [Pseudomonas tructae]|uniref:ATP-grasp domain-containing protein n=1 Tax=Pseudomonas tructae TaxID=2518644 RepID=A0A411MFQ7_9PSED|nr:ATP-grasp domain-containing protein [Pseudomonas tructae]QBF25665.1 ATP-grasp domain-containing protein [Pseudomonas tructae]